MYNQQRVFKDTRVFGKRNFSSSDYTEDMKARILYSASRCALNSQNNFRLYNKAKRIKINEMDNIIRYDTTLISSASFQNEQLTGVNVIKTVDSLVPCNLYDPTPIDTTITVPFYYKYQIDPCNSLFGNKLCEKNNYKYYIQIKKPSLGTNANSLNYCESIPFNACNNNIIIQNPS